MCSRGDTHDGVSDVHKSVVCMFEMNDTYFIFLIDDKLAALGSRVHGFVRHALCLKRAAVTHITHVGSYYR